MDTAVATPRLSQTQQSILTRFKNGGSTGFTFNELGDAGVSPSRARTVVAELRRMGLLKAAGKSMSPFGRRETIWVAV